MIAGLWHLLPPSALAVTALVAGLLLGAVLTLTTVAARLLGFSRADEITLVFCGSKKSLVAGIPIANVLFAGHTVGLVVLPLMLFHQIQLIACAALARRYAARRSGPHAAAPVALAV
jgi:solute carrier family 10 (sodium/bile acid cotransporter), member 7